MKKETFDNYNLVLMYAFNYEYNFIEKAFPSDEDDGSRTGRSFDTDHFVKKFNQYCDESDDNTLGFMKFYASLSDRYKQILLHYILDESDYKHLYNLPFSIHIANKLGRLEYVEKYKPENDENKRKPIREFGFEGL
tara:strand:- start:6 stop:413 length:408 start_codon:yes stop_codon:yes gene_type:complete